MEKKKSNKGLIITIVILIILLLGLAGYICYDKFLTSDEKNNALDDSKKVETKPKEDTNFYSINNLVKNHYLEEITDISRTTSDYVAIKIENGKVYLLKILDEKGEYIESKGEYIEAKGIEGTPKYVWHASPFGGEEAFVVLTNEGEIYYQTSYALYELGNKNFTKLNNKKVKALYDYSSYYPYEIFTLYAEYEDNTFAKISATRNNSGDMTSLKINDITLEKEFAYPDEISGGCNDNTGLFITSDRKLFNRENVKENDSYNYSEIKYNNKSLKVKEAFSVTSSKNNKYILYYVIDEDNNIYVIKQNSSFKITSVKLYKDLKIESYSYNDKKISKDGWACFRRLLTITYKDNSVEKMYIENISTLYDRYNK